MGKVMGFTMKRMAKESNSNPRMHEIGDAKHLQIDFQPNE